MNLNQEIKRITTQYHVQYLDLYSILVTSDGELASDYTTDGLHLSDKGYGKWRDLLITYLD